MILKSLNNNNVPLNNLTNIGNKTLIWVVENSLIISISLFLIFGTIFLYFYYKNKNSVNEVIYLDNNTDFKFKQLEKKHYLVLEFMEKKEEKGEYFTDTSDILKFGKKNNMPKIDIDIILNDLFEYDFIEHGWNELGEITDNWKLTINGKKQISIGRKKISVKNLKIWNN